MEFKKVNSQRDHTLLEMLLQKELARVSLQIPLGPNHGYVDPCLSSPSGPAIVL